MVAQIGVGCDQPCPGDASLLCGGSYGHISVYEVFNYATRALTLTLKDSSGPLASGVSVPTREVTRRQLLRGCQRTGQFESSYFIAGTVSGSHPR